MIEEHTSTAIAIFNPQNDQALIALREQAQGLLKYAELLIIKEVSDLTPASDSLNLIRSLKKAMDARRKDYLEPFQSHIKEVNDSYKRFMAPVEAADRLTSEKMLAFTAEQERIRREQERINAERIKLAEAEMKLSGELSQSIQLVEVLPPTPAVIRTELGSTGLRDHWVFEIESFALLPDEYKMVDVVKLGKVVRAGLRSISGVRIWNEPILAVGK